MKIESKNSEKFIIKQSRVFIYVGAITSFALGLIVLVLVFTGVAVKAEPTPNPGDHTIIILFCAAFMSFGTLIFFLGTTKRIEFNKASGEILLEKVSFLRKKREVLSMESLEKIIQILGRSSEGGAIFHYYLKFNNGKNLYIGLCDRRTLNSPNSWIRLLVDFLNIQVETKSGLKASSTILKNITGGMER